MLTPTKNVPQIEKPIFSSSSYRDSLLAFCDLCFAIIDTQKEFYFICQTCDNFAACFSCIKNAKHQLITHSSDHLFHADKPYSNNHWTNRNLSITCSICKIKHFSGQRYQCRQCKDYNICSNCLDQAKSTHYISEKHNLDSIPNLTKLRFNRHLLAERTIQVLRYRKADDFEQDPITGWTMNEAIEISKQTLELCALTWNEAFDLFKDEDIESPPSIIENEKIDKILITIAQN